MIIVAQDLLRFRNVMLTCRQAEVTDNGHGIENRELQTTWTTAVCIPYITTKYFPQQTTSLLIPSIQANVFIRDNLTSALDVNQRRHLTLVEVDEP